MTAPTRPQPPKPSAASTPSTPPAHSTPPASTPFMESLLRDLLELGNGMAWATSVDPMASLYVSPQVKEILGYPPERWEEPGFWLTTVHPDDRAHVLADNVRQRDPAARDLSHVEYRALTADGRTLWFRDRTRVVYDASGALRYRIGMTVDITAQKEAEARVGEAEARYRDLIERQDAITWVSNEVAGPDVYMSPQVEEILGYPAGRWKEPGFWQTTVHPDDRERVVAASMEATPRVDIEYRALAADGRVVWFREKIRNFRDAGGTLWRYGLAFDVTALKEAEAEREKWVERFRQTVEGLDVAIGIGGDPPGSAMYSRQIEEIVGYTPEELPDYRTWNALIHRDDIEACRAQWASADPSWTMEYRVRHRDGHWVWVRDRARQTYHPDGSFDKLYFVISDATKARAMEEERLTLERRTSDLAKLEALARVAATTAHDFGNVLLGIEVFAKYLERNETLDDRARADARQIRSAVEAGRSATAALVSLGNLSDTTLVEADVHELLRTMTPALYGLLGPAIALRLELKAKPHVVELEPAAFERAVINLAVNARDAMPDGGSLTIETSVVKEDESTPTAAGIALPGRYLSVSVRDDGIGMAPETIEKAFEPYFTTKPVGKGTGLGLSSVHSVTHAVDGHVHLDSRLGEGTAFRICIPIL